MTGLLSALSKAGRQAALRSDLGPNDAWLQSKIERSRRAMSEADDNTYSSNLGQATVTGTYDDYLRIDPRVLADVPGAMGEERYRPDPRKIGDLRADIARDGYQESPILVHVREDGEPFVVEGNHRIIEAIESGRPTIPVRVEYLRGAEDVDGMLSPSALGVIRSMLPAGLSGILGSLMGENRERQ